jgi:hypothetical protein
MVNDGLSVSEAEMHPWHGAKKEAVIAHFAESQGTPPGPELEKRIAKCGADFEAEIDKAYFQPGSPVSLIHPDVLSWIKNLQAQGTKVGLDTGYPPNIQVRIWMCDFAFVPAFSIHLDIAYPLPFRVFTNMHMFFVLSFRLSVHPSFLFVLPSFLPSFLVAYPSIFL